jgi:molybdenum cofactor cytidylyltransferase
MDSTAAILLAAGRSRRMGAFKPLLPFGDKSVIQTCIDTLRAGGVQTIAVVIGHRADEIKQHLSGQDLLFAVNDDPDSEMAVSIACGIRVLPADTKAILIALTDHPAVPASVVSLLLDQWRHGARLVVPEFQGRGGHPILLDAAFRDQLLAVPAEGGLRSFLRFHQSEVQRIPANSGFIARDMDTWDDYQALHQEVFGVPPTTTVDSLQDR